MSKSQKEIAFLRDLTVTKDWTDRFTNFTDKHLKPLKEGNFLYFNAGTLSHALELREKFEDEVNLVCICDDAELKLISEAKSNLMKARIKFADLKELESESFDEVLADLSFVQPNEIGEILDELVFLTKKGGKILFFLPTAGSFGEIFSYLWETFLDIDLVEKSAEIENLISEIPSVSDTEAIAKEAGLKSIESEISNEVFEYETGKDFISSTLLSDFLFPVWLKFLGEKERKKAIQKMAQLIDNEADKLSFRFSVKATLVEGIKK